MVKSLFGQVANFILSQTWVFPCLKGPHEEIVLLFTVVNKLIKR